MSAAVVDIADRLRRASSSVAPRAGSLAAQARRLAPEVLAQARGRGREAIESLLAPRARLDGLDLDLRPPILAGLALVGAGFFGFLVWAATAPLHSAVIAPGWIAVETQRKAVQHLEGGIVERVLVADGDEVEAGAVVIRLDSGQAHARRGQLEARLLALGAEKARLEAEFADQSSLVLDPTLDAYSGDARLARAVALQEDLLRGRREERDRRAAALRAQIAQAGEEIRGVSAQLEGRERRLAIALERLEATRALGENGHASRAQIGAVEGELASIEGERGDLSARMAATEQKRGQLVEELDGLDRAWRTEVADRLQAIERSFGETLEGLAAAQDVLARTEVRSPASGTVQSLAVHGPGAVVQAGAKLLEVVPREDALVVEGSLRPEDVEDVRRGQQVFIRLAAFSFRNTAPIPGELVEVSADRIVDPRTGLASYAVKASLDEAALAAQGLALKPGMPADVMVVQRERTLLDYLLDPLLQATERAFREH